MKTKIFLKIFFFILIFLNPSFAEVIKPNSSIDPSQVVKIQLSALMKNDFPNKDKNWKCHTRQQLDKKIHKRFIKN